MFLKIQDPPLESPVVGFGIAASIAQRQGWVNSI